MIMGLVFEFCDKRYILCFMRCIIFIQIVVVIPTIGSNFRATNGNLTLMNSNSAPVVKPMIWGRKINVREEYSKPKQITYSKESNHSSFGDAFNSPDLVEQSRISFNGASRAAFNRTPSSKSKDKRPNLNLSTDIKRRHALQAKSDLGIPFIDVKEVTRTRPEVFPINVENENKFNFHDKRYKNGNFRRGNVQGKKSNLRKELMRSRTSSKTRTIFENGVEKFRFRIRKNRRVPNLFKSPVVDNFDVKKGAAEWSVGKDAATENIHMKKRRSNIILIMTDDLDVELGSLNYMPKLLRLMGDGGALFSNAYTTTPMCCPSRSSILTGMYIHNHQVFTNHQNCSSPLWQKTHEKRSFASYLRNAGYKTGYFGKYLNRYNGSHVPNGWTDWAGLIMNSRYYNYTVNRNNRHVKYGHKYPHDYYPHVITNDGMRFLQESKNETDPFLLVLSYPAPHGPEDSAPEHAHKYFNASDHHTASYNYAPNPDKQWILQFTDRMPDIPLKFTDLLMTKRLQTLQTIDESLEKIINAVRDVGKSDDTYIFFTSDHGYHLGQFGLPKGKSMPFEFDVKVPFLVIGPGVKPGVDLSNIALNVDLAPTFLDIANVPRPSHIDGRSLLPVLRSSSNREKLDEIPWRDSFLIESSGRLREEELLEKKEKRSWEREKVLTETFLKSYSNQSSSNNTNKNGIDVGLYTSKHERLEEVCQRIEFSKPCQPTQKWYCVKIGWRWKIKKCRSRPMGVWHKHCICHFMQGFGTYRKLDAKERRKQRHFLKKYVTKDLRKFDSKFIQSFNSVDSPLQFGPSVSISNHDLKHNKRRKNGHYRLRRSLRESDENTSWELPLYFDFENLTKHMKPVVVRIRDDISSLNEAIILPDLTSIGANERSGRDDIMIPLLSSDDRGGNVHSLTHLDNSEREKANDMSLLVDPVVHNFVEEKELQDLKDQIHNIADEISSLENENNSGGESNIEAKNNSIMAESGNHGCHANAGRIDCQNEVYEDMSVWNTSKVAIEDNIRRLKQQLRVMKNILQHLQSKKPDLFDVFGNYDAFDDDELPVEEGTFYEDDVKDHRISATEEASNAEQIGFDGIREMTQNGKTHRRKNSNRNLATSGRRHKWYRDRNGEDVTRKLYYPISLPDTENEVPGNTLQSRFCWCDKRIIRKISIQETRDRKRQERVKVREKIQQRKQRRQRKKQKSVSCNFSTLNCYTHDNQHWKTPPLWTDGQFCFCINSPNNTYWCLRTINETHNFLYCEFITGLITYYDLHIDPYQLRNVAFTLSKEKVLELNNKLTRLRGCKGVDECDGFTDVKTGPKTGKGTPPTTDILSFENKHLSHFASSKNAHEINYRKNLRKKNFKLETKQRRKKLKKKLRKSFNKKTKLDVSDPYWKYPLDLSTQTDVQFDDGVRVARRIRHNNSETKDKGRKKNRRRRRNKKKKKKKNGMKNFNRNFIASKAE